MPEENGTWVVLFAPFVIGILAAWRFAIADIALAGALFFLCLLRTPLSLLAAADFKSFPSQTKPTLIVATAHGLFLGLILLLRHHLWLLLPMALLGFLLFALESRRKRGDTRAFLSICALTLSAPAAFYASSGTLTPVALLLWLICITYFSITTIYTWGWFKNRVIAKKSPLVLLTHSALFTTAIALIFSLVRA